MVVEEAEEWASSETTPASPQSIIVLEKAMMHKGHLGSNINKIVVKSPTGFFRSETDFLFLHGLQSFFILETVNMV